MLSRDADSLYWLSRYVERAENTARILDVAARLSSLPSSFAEGHINAWESALTTASALEGFKEIYDEPTPRNVIEFLAFSEKNPSSIRNCLDTARQNARGIRGALTSEMWEAINGAWLDMQGQTSRIELADLTKFLEWVKECSLRFDGSALRTMLRNDAFWFSRLGLHIERADNTARVLDVKYYVLLPRDAEVGGGLDYYHWSAILRSVSALVSYQWVYRQNLKPWLIAEFLIFKEEMPRSLASCYSALSLHLDEIAGRYGVTGMSQRLARQSHARLSNGRVEEIFQSGLHEFIQGFIAENTRLSATITEQYLL